ncbi:putative coat protein [Gymnadenia amalgavirus 2]|nr:putative coat protein [Gymnadenia amalgavirus 2]
MASRVAPLSFRPVPTEEELNQSLEAKLNIFRNAGLRLTELRIEHFLEINLTFEDASKMLRFLESFINQGILLPLISQAEHYAIILAKVNLGALDLWRFVNWLKTTQGTAVIRKVQTERKLLKKSTVQRSARDISYSRLLNLEHVDLSAEVKEVQAEVDNGVAEHTAAIQALKDRGEKRIKKIREEYSAAANFPDPTVDRLHELCWALYLDRCTADGSIPARKTNDALKRVTDEYRQEVAQTVVMEYCDDENVRQHLADYGKKKIKHLKAHKKKKELGRFRDLLATAVGEPPVALPTPEPPSDDEIDSDGSGAREPSRAGLLDTVAGEGTSKTAEQSGSRRKKKTPTPKRVRVAKLAGATPVAKRTRKNRKKYQRAEALDDSSL